MKKLMLAVLALILFASVAQAMDYPDITGKWKGTSEAIIAGQSVHEGKLAKPTILENQWFLNISGQEGRFFWGTTGSTRLTEEFIGFIEDDGTTLYLVDEDGHMVGKIQGNKIVIHYTESSGDSMVAAYNVFTKQ